MTIEQQVALYLDHLDRRLSRLETLEATGGGGGGGDLFLIETKTLTVAGIIQFLNIPSTAKSILYTGNLLGAGSNMAMIINGGATATDLSNLMNMTCSTTSGVTTFGNVRMGVIQSSVGVGAPSDVFSAIFGLIPDAQEATNHTGTMAWSGVFTRDDFVHDLRQGRGGGNWDKSGPITQIDIVHDGAGAAQWQAGSIFTLYGLTS